MKNSTKKIVSLLLAVLLIFSLFSCDITTAQETSAATSAIESPQNTNSPESTSDSNEIAAEGLWKDAIYRSDKEFGNGTKTVMVEVKVGDQSITFTLKTDKNTLGEALSEHSLIDGEQGAYGLYIKKVNGITADYDIDQSYWGFYKNGEYMMTGIDQTQFSDGEHYELVYTK